MQLKTVRTIQSIVEGEQAMKIMERIICRVKSGKWAELETVEKKYDALESQWGFPPKRRYRALYGSLSRDFYITEREWDGMDVREAALGNGFRSPQWLALGEELNLFVESLQIEIYQGLE
jgi:hypothetical protein